MRLGLLILAIVLLGAPSIGHACLEEVPPYGHSPESADLPLRGSIFMAPRRYGLPNVQWMRGHGTVATKSLGLVANIDYVADGDALLAINGAVLYTISATAAPPRVPRSVSLHRDDGYCGNVSIAVDAAVAAVKARLVRGDRVEDYWLVDARGWMTLEPACDPDYASMEVATLELFATLADGREQRLQAPIAVRHIPIHALDDAPESPLDWLRTLALLGVLVVAFGGALARPRIAVHGVAVRNYLPKLRFRIRLPRATVHRG